MQHALTNDHAVDFANAKVIDNSGPTEALRLKTLESWHTALTDKADNN